ncbi:MAG TPA: SWIM zinc finger family protein, partial [Chroococcales cyanobacterium]
MTSATQSGHLYRYPFHSRLDGADGAPQLRLATSQDAESTVYPHFFDGKLLRPHLTAQLLNGLARVVSTRYYIPPNMLNRMIAERDPVVTSGGGMLRFEGFSACCSSYVRVDLTPDSYSGKIVGQGTTNVDFNQPMRASLVSVRDDDRLALKVGADEVSLKRGFEEVIERKVDLPLRWLKGFVEIQSYQSAMELRFDIPKIEAVRFLRSLPRSATAKSTFYVVPSGKGLRLSQVKTAEAVPISGLQRLHLLADMAPLADRLRIYAQPSGQASEWQLQLGPLSVSITMTAEVMRGFSGEGQVLQDLAAVDDSRLARVRAALKWQSIIDIADIAQTAALPEDEVRKLLAVLGSRGLVGYDLANAAYFHRELPFDLGAVEEMHPRLVNARRLAGDGKVNLLRRTESEIEARVAGTDVEHRVLIEGENARCTCPWHSKHQGARGPCKHILATQI